VIKRFVVAVTALTLIVPQPANGAVKVGSVCKVSGLTVVQAGATIKCIKSGKKLTWVLLKKAVEKSKTAAKPSSTQSGNTGSDTNSNQTSNNNQSPKSNKPISSASDFAVLTDKLINEVWAKAKTQTHDYQILIEPGYEKAPYAIESAKLVQATLDFTAALGAAPTTPSRIYMPFNWSWVQKYIDKSTYCYDATWVGGAYCGNGVLIQNLAHFKYWMPTGLEPVPAQPYGQAFTRQLSHEFAHQSQDDLLNRFGRNTSFYPAWLREGGPEIISMAAFMKVYNVSYLEIRDHYLNFSSPYCRRVKMNDLLMSDNHPDDCQGVSGVIATEALIAKTGNLESLFAFPRSKIAGFGPKFDVDRRGISNETYKSVMKEIYGIDVDSWHPVVEAEFVKWATCSRSKGDIEGCYFIRD
jgi:hypothetical protein